MARAVIDQLPHEAVLYVATRARGPYGPLPLAQGVPTPWTSWTTSSNTASRRW